METNLDLICSGLGLYVLPSGQDHLGMSYRASLCHPECIWLPAIRDEGLPSLHFCRTITRPSTFWSGPRTVVPFCDLHSLPGLKIEPDVTSEQDYAATHQISPQQIVRRVLNWLKLPDEIVSHNCWDNILRTYTCPLFRFCCCLLCGKLSIPWQQLMLPRIIMLCETVSHAGEQTDGRRQACVTGDSERLMAGVPTYFERDEMSDAMRPAIANISSQAKYDFCARQICPFSTRKVSR
ncbi:hypothetical protein V8C35DRAFT_152827 [Trichoderma chlorosporum]